MAHNLHQTQTWSVMTWETTISDSLVEGVTPSTDIPLTNDNVTAGLGEAGGLFWSWIPVQWSWVEILQLVSAILGIMGNMLVLLVLLQRRRHCRSTDTLVAALATADLLTSVFLIPIPRATTVPNNWCGLAYCKIVYPSWYLWTCVSASIYTLMAISIERFIAVSYPIYFRHSLSRRSVSFWIVGVWLIAFLTGLRSSIIARVNTDTHKCLIYYNTRTEQISYGCFVFAVRIAIPVLTLLLTQSAIAFKLQRYSAQFQNDVIRNGAQSTSHIVAKNRVIKMMLIVIIIYVICWSPNQIAFFGYNLGLLPPSYRYSTLNSVFTIMGFYNSCANPVIYTARHPEFRKALQGLFCRGPVKFKSLFGQEVMSETGGTALTLAEDQARKMNASENIDENLTR